MTNEHNRGPARENEPSKQPESVTVFPLGKVDADAFEKALNNPPEPNDELRKLMTEHSSDMVERVARAISLDRHGAEGRWPHYESAAIAVIEASHHAELVEAASKFASMAHRAGPTTDLYWAACERLEAVLAKIGGDA